MGMPQPWPCPPSLTLLPLQRFYRPSPHSVNTSLTGEATVLFLDDTTLNETAICIVYSDKLWKPNRSNPQPDNQLMNTVNAVHSHGNETITGVRAPQRPPDPSAATDSEVKTQLGLPRVALKPNPDTTSTKALYPTSGRGPRLREVGDSAVLPEGQQRAVHLVTPSPLPLPRPGLFSGTSDVNPMLLWLRGFRQCPSQAQAAESEAATWGKAVTTWQPP